MASSEATDVLPTVDGPVDVRMSVPGSKSVTNRALVCAALATGESRLRNCAPGDDTSAMLECLGGLGIETSVSDSSISVQGVRGSPRGGGILDSRLAGTTSRFLTALASLSDESTTITGSTPLLARPMKDLHDALRSLGAVVTSLNESDHLPVAVRRGHLSGGRIRIRGDVSSQFVTSLMLIGPYLAGGLRLDIEGALVSRPYVDMTAKIMAAFSATGIAVDSSSIIVDQGSYRGREFHVEPDASSASYVFAAAAITGGRALVEGLSRKSLQGDIRILSILEDMGCRVSAEHDSCLVEGSARLVGLDIDMADVSDLVPTVCAVALFADSVTRIRGIGFIRNKESDRIGNMVRGINSIGGRATELEDGLEIEPVAALGANPVRIPTDHDHRLAMAWSLIALRRPGISVLEPGVVSKSWPEWWTVRETIRRSSEH